MKKFYCSFSLILTLTLVALAFTSCKKEQGTEIDKYIFVEPCMDWTADMNKVIEYTKALGDEWIEDKDNVGENELHFANKKYLIQIDYSFENGLLREASVFYLFNKDFNQLKADWAAKYNLTWTEKSVMGFTFFEAENSAKKCNFIVQQGNSSGFDYMEIAAKYSNFI